jgi:hypothetical protein
MRSGPLRPGTDRPAGHGKAGTSLDQPTPCSQSQIEQECHLRRERTAQVKAAVVLSVVVRFGPVMTAVNGMLAARAVRMTRHRVVPLAPLWPQGEAGPR